MAAPTLGRREGPRLDELEQAGRSEPRGLLGAVQALMGLAPAPMVLIAGADASSARVLDVNAAFEEVVGQHPPTGERMANLPYQFMEKDGITRMSFRRLPTIRAIETRAPVGETEFWVERANGERRLVAIRAAPLFEGGQVVGALGVAHDRTDAWRSEEKLRLFVEHAPAAVAMLDCDMRYLAVSHRWLSDYRLKVDDVVGRSHYEVFPDLPERWKEIHRRCLAGAVERSEEDPFPRQDGTLDWVRWEIRPWRDRAGHIGGIMLFSEVVTERKQAQEALRESEERYRALVELSPDGIFLHDGRHITFANDEAARLFRAARAQDLVGLPVERLIHPDSRALVAERASRLDQVGKFDQPIEVKGWRVDGTVFDVEAAGSRVSLGGRPVFQVVLRDITERKQAAAEVKKSRDALLEADRRKTEFLAVLSHELRNPLAPIRNSLHVLERAPADSERARHAMQVVDRQVAQLTRLVDDLLDVTRISRGKVQLRRERVDLGEIVRRAVEDHRFLFERSGVRLDLVDAPGALVVEADASRLTQVVGNLLSNAAKFTDRGKATTVTVSEHEGQAVLEVADQGQGMAPETLQHLFEPFMQAESTLARSRGGLGLGLALVKGIVDLHGGQIAARSEGLGRGARFEVRLPLAPGETARAGAGADKPRGRHHRRVLVVEDNVDAAESLREVLELEGHEVAVAFQGTDGVEAARRLRPEVVLCDLGLPGMDGYEVARTLRRERAGPAPLLVALSGYAQPEDLERSAAAGFDIHLAKPPDLNQLERIIEGARR